MQTHFSDERGILSKEKIKLNKKSNLPISECGVGNCVFRVSNNPAPDSNMHLKLTEKKPKERDIILCIIKYPNCLPHHSHQQSFL